MCIRDSHPRSPGEPVPHRRHSRGDGARRKGDRLPVSRALLIVLALHASATTAPPAPGEAVGRERARAVAAIGSARSAIGQAPAGSARTEAEARLAEAESLLARARYAEAAAQADGAWKLLAEARGERSHFAVAVEPDGRTRVAVREGVPVRVEAQGRARAVRAGETLTVVRGEPPGTPQLDAPGSTSTAEPPILISPEPGLKLALEPAPGGLGPVRFAWKPVSYTHLTLPTSDL